MSSPRPPAVVATALTVLLLVAHAGSALPARASAPRPDLQALLDTVVEAGAPGIAAFVRDDRGTWQGAAGVADADSGRRMEPGLRFRVGSLAKPFVATVVLQLVDEGRLGLDDPVGAVLPGVLPDGQAITVRHLLQHTSGVPDYLPHVAADFWIDPRAPHRTWTPAELVATVADGPRLFPPGSDWSYSNTGYTLLGMTVERVTGQQLDRVLAERIVRPLDLADTWLPTHARGFGGPAAHGTSSPYDTDFEVTGPPEDATHYNPSAAWASGGLISTAADLAAFESALLGGDLLAPERLAELRTTIDTGLTQPQRYGLGVGELDLPCGTAVGHSGGIAGYTTYAFSSPDASRQVMLLMNTDAVTEDIGTALERTLVSAFCGEDRSGAAATTVTSPAVERRPVMVR